MTAFEIYELSVTLKADVERLRADVERLTTERDEAHAEVERLTKAANRQASLDSSRQSGEDIILRDFLNLKDGGTR